MKVTFLTELVVEKLAGDFWRVAQEFRAQAADQVITVPAGTVTDFASVPRLPLVFVVTGCIGQKAATLHDWLYSQGRFPRAWCDQVLRDALAAEGVGWFRRQAMYLAVRAAGAGHYRAEAA